MTAKKKRDLISTLETIERYHQRRSVFTIHLVLSLAIQITVWANWFASYAPRGMLFEGAFFADRAIISLVLFLFLGGHLALMRQRESRDRLVIEALRESAALTESLSEDDDEASGDSANAARVALDAEDVATIRQVRC